MAIERQEAGSVHCTKSNQNFRDLTQNVEENDILHKIFRVVSRFPRYISCYISENRLPLGQCRPGPPEAGKGVRGVPDARLAAIDS